MIASNSSSFTVTLTSSSAVTPPNFKVALRTASGGETIPPFVVMTQLLPLAENLNIPEEEALHIYAEMADSCARNAIAILDNPPAIIANDPDSLYILHRAATEIVEEVENKTMEFYDDFDYDRRFSHNQQTEFNSWYEENITPPHTTAEDDADIPHIGEPAAQL